MPVRSNKTNKGKNTGNPKNEAATKKGVETQQPDQKKKMTLPKPDLSLFQTTSLTIFPLLIVIALIIALLKGEGDLIELLKKFGFMVP